jgi:AhpD family alkylhydroperoxidase
MGMPRLSPVDAAEMTNSQKLLVDIADTLGAPDPEIARILVRSEIGRIWLRAWTELLNGGVLPVPIKEMCRVFISAKHQCGYCSTVRSETAKRHGLSEEKLMSALDYETSELLSEREKTALRFASRYLGGDNALDDDGLYEELKAQFSEEEIIELGIVCAETAGMGKFAISIQVRTWEQACEIQPRLRAQPAPVPVDA